MKKVIVFFFAVTLLMIGARVSAQQTFDTPFGTCVKDRMLVFVQWSEYDSMQTVMCYYPNWTLVFIQKDPSHFVIESQYPTEKTSTLLAQAKPDPEAQISNGKFRKKPKDETDAQDNLKKELAVRIDKVMEARKKAHMERTDQLTFLVDVEEFKSVSSALRFINTAYEELFVEEGHKLLQRMPDSILIHINLEQAKRGRNSIIACAKLNKDSKLRYDFGIELRGQVAKSIITAMSCNNINEATVKTMMVPSNRLLYILENFSQYGDVSCNDAQTALNK